MVITPFDQILLLSSTYCANLSEFFLLIYRSIDYKIGEYEIIPTIFTDMQTNYIELFSAGRDLRVTIIALGYYIPLNLFKPGVQFCHSHILSLIIHQIWLDLAFNLTNIIS